MMKRRDLEKVYAKYNDLSVPDPNFNPARNKAVVAETIKEAETYHKNVHSVIDDNLGERIEAVAAYGCYRLNRGFKNPKDYFGKKLYEKFIGEKLLQKLRIMDTVNRLNGNSKFKKSVLL